MARKNDNQNKEVPEVTNYGPTLLQDYDRGLSKALSNTPHARRHAREAVKLIKENNGNTGIKSKG